MLGLSWGVSEGANGGAGEEAGCWHPTNKKRAKKETKKRNLLVKKLSITFISYSCFSC